MDVYVWMGDEDGMREGVVHVPFGPLGIVSTAAESAAAHAALETGCQSWVWTWRPRVSLPDGVRRCPTRLLWAQGPERAVRRVPSVPPYPQTTRHMDPYPISVGVQFVFLHRWREVADNLPRFKAHPLVHAWMGNLWHQRRQVCPLAPRRRPARRMAAAHGPLVSVHPSPPRPSNTRSTDVSDRAESGRKRGLRSCSGRQATVRMSVSPESGRAGGGSRPHETWPRGACLT